MALPSTGTTIITILGEYYIKADNTLDVIDCNNISSVKEYINATGTPEITINGEKYIKLINNVFKGYCNTTSVSSDKYATIQETVTSDLIQPLGEDDEGSGVQSRAAISPGLGGSTAITTKIAAFKGYANLNSKEAWEGKLTLNSYKLGGTPITTHLPGTTPHFKKKLIKCTSNTTLERTSTYLKIGSTTFYKGDFEDGVIPLRLLAILQGGGGGGGGSKNSASGAGGGGGALGVFTVDIKYYPNLNIIVGAGGSGGYGDGQDGSGGAGGLTQIKSPLSDTQICAVNGGGGAAATTTVANSTGGSGGYPSVQIVNGKSWNCGVIGGGSGGPARESGNSTLESTIYCSSRSEDTYRSKTFLAMSGGSDTANQGGGGGASPSAAGGNGGGTGATGSTGSDGSGGGGGSYKFANYIRGGAGGTGYIEFYY